MDQGESMSLEPLVRLELEVGAPVEIGPVDGYTRRFVPIVGGRVTGAFEGRILSGGGDWQLLRPDGTLDLEARYVLEVGSARIEVHSVGLRSGSYEVMARLLRNEPVAAHEYYFRTAMRFRTAAAELQYLNRLLAVTSGERHASCVRLLVYRVP